MLSWYIFFMPLLWYLIQKPYSSILPSKTLPYSELRNKKMKKMISMMMEVQMLRWAIGRPKSANRAPNLTWVDTLQKVKTSGAKLTTFSLRRLPCSRAAPLQDQTGKSAWPVMFNVLNVLTASFSDLSTISYRRTTTCSDRIETPDLSPRFHFLFRSMG